MEGRREAGGGRREEGGGRKEEGGGRREEGGGRREEGGGRRENGGRSRGREEKTEIGMKRSGLFTIIAPRILDPYLTLPKTSAVKFWSILFGTLLQINTRFTRWVNKLNYACPGE